MGMLQDVIQHFLNRNKEVKEELGDDETRDKFLRSLRRQDRVQQEEIEKEMLKKKIAAFIKARNRKHMWGIGEKSIINSKKVTGHGKQSFLGKSNL